MTHNNIECPHCHRYFQFDVEFNVHSPSCMDDDMRWNYGRLARQQEGDSQPKQAEMQAISFKKGEKPQIKLETSLGTIVVELWPDVAPVHCKNFYYLAQKGFYDSLLVHRVISGFVLQSGDPNGDGSGGPGYSIPGEFSDHKHVKGTLSMARSQDPNSAGSQFFICLGPTPNLDTKYSVFGQTVEGMEVIDKFNQVKTVANNCGDRSRPETPIYLLKATVLTQ